MKKKILTTAGAILTLAAFVSLCFAFNSYVAKSKDLELVAMRLEQKIAKDKIDYLQERVWQLKDYYMKNPPMPLEIRKEILMLETEIEELKIQLYKQGG